MTVVSVQTQSEWACHEQFEKGGKVRHLFAAEWEKEKMMEMDLLLPTG